MEVLNSTKDCESSSPGGPQTLGWRLLFAKHFMNLFAHCILLMSNILTWQNHCKSFMWLKWHYHTTKNAFSTVGRGSIFMLNSHTVTPKQLPPRTSSIQDPLPQNTHLPKFSERPLIHSTHTYNPQSHVYTLDIPACLMTPTHCRIQQHVQKQIQKSCFCFFPRSIIN